MAVQFVAVAAADRFPQAAAVGMKELSDNLIEVVVAAGHTEGYGNVREVALAFAGKGPRLCSFAASVAAVVVVVTVVAVDFVEKESFVVAAAVKEMS